MTIRLVSLRALVPAAGLGLVVLASGSAQAACGDPNHDGRVTTSDALYTLKAGVASVSCSLSLCDVNASGTVNAADALRVLRTAAGLPPGLACAADTEPGDDDYSEQWGLAAIRAPKAWDYRTDCSDVIVSVIDTGVDYYHDDLEDNLWRNPGEIPYNGKDDDNNGFKDDVFGWDFAKNDEWPWDPHGHGTHVAGIIGASANGTGTVGVCWNARIMAMRFLNEFGFGFASDSLQAMDYSRKNGAKVINNSWGGGPRDSGEFFSFKAASDADIVIVNAAGNDSADLEIVEDFPTQYQVLTQINVAATAEDGGLAGFSNFGATQVHVAAPGAGILSTFPHDEYILSDGTSMAAPFVAGAATLLRAEYPFLSALDVKRILINSSAFDSDLEGTVVSNGLIDLEIAFLQASLAADDTPGSFAKAGVTPAPAALKNRRTLEKFTSGESKYPNLQRAEENWSDGGSATATMVADHVIAVLESPSVMADLKKAGFEIRRQLATDQVTVLVEAPVSIDDTEAALKNVPGVLSVTPDYVLTMR